MLRTVFQFAVVMATTTAATLGLAASGVTTPARGPSLASAGPLAFGPAGVLFIGDAKSATIFAVQTEDTAGNPDAIEIDLEGIDAKVAALLGTTADNLLINDLAANPSSGKVYLSVSRGRGPDAAPVIVRVAADGGLSELNLAEVEYTTAALPNAPEDKASGEGRRRRNPRRESITDLVYLNGELYVAGLSNEEFASKLRSIPYPFAGVDDGASIEIFHASHGRWETRSPVRTFAAYEDGDETTLLAAYTCTPLVKIPVAMLESGQKVTGETVAELGNHNRPLDMVVYTKGDQDFVLMANSSRGLMKISMRDLPEIKPLTERVGDKAGLAYDTIGAIEGVVQLDRLNNGSAVVLVQGDEGMSLKTIDLP